MLSFDFFRIAETAVAAKYPQTTKTRRMIFNPSGMATFFKYNGKRHKNTGFNSSLRSELSLSLVFGHFVNSSHFVIFSITIGPISTKLGIQCP